MDTQTLKLKIAQLCKRTTNKKKIKKYLCVIKMAEQGFYSKKNKRHVELKRLHNRIGRMCFSSRVVTCTGFGDDGKKIWRRKYGSIAQRQREGTRKGISDYFIIIPPELSVTGSQLHFWIEMKKPKIQLLRKSKRGQRGDWVSQPGSQPTEEQLVFIDMVNNHRDTCGVVCYGFDEAVELLSKYLNQ